MDVKRYMEDRRKQRSLFRSNEVDAFDEVNMRLFKSGAYLALTSSFAGLAIASYNHDKPSLIWTGSAVVFGLLGVYNRIIYAREGRRLDNAMRRCDEFTDNIMKELEEEMSSRTMTESAPR